MTCRGKKELLAAGLIKDYRFINEDEYRLYIHELNCKKMRYQILERVTRENGTVLLRISLGYNQTPLIQLYED